MPPLELAKMTIWPFALPPVGDLSASWPSGWNWAVAVAVGLALADVVDVDALVFALLSSPPDTSRITPATTRIAMPPISSAPPRRSARPRRGVFGVLAAAAAAAA